MAYAMRVTPGCPVRLAECDPDFDAGLTVEEGMAEFASLNAQLQELQQELYACRHHSVLLVLQGLDSSGKDGAIRNVLLNTDPQGCRVEQFKKPTEEELAHDFLWRVHRVAPARGMIGVFNRSHYEDVVAVRVHRLVPPEVWTARYAQINDFERMLAANGTIVLKFYLHISREEQERRLMSRERKKAWKLSENDWTERELWNDYLEAYSDAMTHCTTPEAPWHVVPANKKWFRNLAISEAVVEALRHRREEWAAALENIRAERAERACRAAREKVSARHGRKKGK